MVFGILETIGDNFTCQKTNLQSIELPSLKEIGGDTIFGGSTSDANNKLQKIN